MGARSASVLRDGDGNRHLLPGSVGDGFKDVFFGASRNSAANLGLEILISGAVANIQDDAPDEIRSEAAGKHNDEHRQSLPQHRSSVLQGDRLDGIARGEPIGEAGAHHARKRGDQQSFLQIEFLDRGTLLLASTSRVLWNSRCSRECDPEKADGDAAQE